MTIRDADRKPRPVCSSCGRKAGTLVEVFASGVVGGRFCFGCIADLRIAGHDVEVTTPRPAVRA